MLYAILMEHGKNKCLRCDHVIVGGLHEDELGSMFACRQDSCPYEKENMCMGECNGEEVRLRLLHK
jgi:hypothetical protein